jgi:8-oxo-dGTP diphosphatase
MRGGRVLAARRSAPAALAGGWEFPGGKVEPGESPAAALARECREELGVRVAVGELLGTADVAPGIVLHVHVAGLIAGEPQPLEDHDELRWLAADELEDVAWLPADRPLLAAVRARIISVEPLRDLPEGGSAHEA